MNSLGFSNQQGNGGFSNPSFSSLGNTMQPKGNVSASGGPLNFFSQSVPSNPQNANPKGLFSTNNTQNNNVSLSQGSNSFQTGKTLNGGFLGQGTTNQVQNKGFNTQPSLTTQQNTGFATQSAGFTSQPTGFAKQSAGFPSQPTGLLSQQTGFPQPTGFPSQPTGFPSQSTGFPSQPTGFSKPSLFGPQNNPNPNQTSGFTQGNSNNSSNPGFGKISIQGQSGIFNNPKPQNLSSGFKNQQLLQSSNSGGSGSQANSQALFNPQPKAPDFSQNSSSSRPTGFSSGFSNKSFMKSSPQSILNQKSDIGIYSELLTEVEIQAFKSAKFEYGKIPYNPPSKDLC